MTERDWLLSVEFPGWGYLSILKVPSGHKFWGSYFVRAHYTDNAGSSEHTVRVEGIFPTALEAREFLTDFAELRRNNVPVKGRKDAR